MYNRKYFEQLLKEIDIEENLPIAIIMGDLNGLKMINEIFRHKEGDKILKTTGRINIPLLSRIIGVADSYDAMTNDRTYREALSMEMAKEELRNNSGKQFDPEIVDIFINSVLEN